MGNSETDSQESDNSLAKIKDENLSDDESMESPFSTPTEKSNRLIKEELQNENSPFNCPETNKGLWLTFNYLFETNYLLCI